MLPVAKLQPALDAERWIVATYRVHGLAETIDARAQAIALEQSVELPLEAVDDSRVLRDVVAQVVDTEPAGPETFTVPIRLAAETSGIDGGELLNMLFGNQSLHGL